MYLVVVVIVVILFSPSCLPACLMCSFLIACSNVT
jgi:hypothetical protein